MATTFPVARAQGLRAQQHDTLETPRSSILRYVWPHVGGQRRRVAELVALVVLNLSYAVALPLATKYLVDSVVPSQSPAALGFFCGVVFGLYVVNALVGVRRAYVTGLVTQHISIGLASTIFAHLQQLPRAFYASRKLGDVAARLSGDLLMIEQALATAVGVTLFLVLTAVVSAATAIALNPALGVLLLLVLPLFAILHSVLRTRLQRESFAVQQHAGAVAATVQENLAAHTEVQAFGLERWALAEYQTRLRAQAHVTLRLVVTGAAFESSMILATTLGQLVILGVGGFLIMQGQLSVGSLLAFVGLLAALFQPVSALSNLAQTAHKAVGALTRINEVLDEPVAITDRPDAVSLPPLQHDIHFNHVVFGYEPNRPVLKDISLSLPAGGRIAIVGPSGSGKSSLISLLLRFSDPTSGSILFDGRDLQDVTLTSLRGQMGVVLQDTFLFDATIRDNIALGRPEARDEDIVAAASAAHLHEFIQSLPEGYQTVLGERGVRMSGGQRQRLALARALIRNPRLLILDEPTSALDLETERDILATLDDLGHERTTILVTHRLGLAATADWIVVLEDGRVVEQGRHTELLEAGGVYHRLWQAGAAA